MTRTTCCIVGGGPAGAMLALLLARKGVPVLLLEAHKDFDREYRVDTLHPYILEILEDLGLADALHHIRHTKIRQMTAITPTGSMLYRPGLLLIGDAAYVMTPIGGVGINLAIQDAVVAANILSEPLQHGSLQIRRAVSIFLVAGVHHISMRRHYGDKGSAIRSSAFLVG